jgi:hypothetical protein
MDLKRENWPESVWARIQDGIPPDDFRDQKFPEVFEGDALKFNIALLVLTEHERGRIYVHYVIPVGVKEKMFRLGQDKSSYYRFIAHCHRRLANAMQYDAS